MKTQYSPQERAIFVLALLLAAVILFHAGKGFMNRRWTAGASRRTQVTPAADFSGERGYSESGVVGELPAVKLSGMPTPGRQHLDVPAPAAPSRRQP